jgi:hypothetical protein
MERKKVGILALTLVVIVGIAVISGCVGQTPTTSGVSSASEAAAPHQQIFEECAKNFKASTYQSMTDAQLQQFASYVQSGSYTDPVTLLQKSVKSATSVSKLDNAKLYMKEAAALFTNSKAWDVNQQLAQTDINCYAALGNDYIQLPNGEQLLAYGEPSDLCTKLAASPTQGLLLKGKRTFECFAEQQAGKALEKLSKRYLAVIEAELAESYQADSPVGNLLKGVLTTPTATTAATTCDPNKVIELKVGSRIDCLPGAEFVGKSFMTMYAQIKDGYSYPGGKFLLKNVKWVDTPATLQTTDIDFDIPSSNFTQRPNSLSIPSEVAKSLGIKNVSGMVDPHCEKTYDETFTRHMNYYNGDDIHWKSCDTDIIKYFNFGNGTLLLDYPLGKATVTTSTIRDTDGDGIIDFIVARAYSGTF